MLTSRGARSYPTAIDMRSRASAHAVSRLAVILALCASLAGVGFVHTDDGCVVEKHCKACVAALSVGVVVTAFVIVLTPEHALLVTAAEPFAPASRESGTTPSRGPPQA
jgi:hypothetical protein